MVFDNIRNCKMYYGVNERFEKAFDFIKKAVEENLEVGKYEIDGKEVYALVQEYDSKTEDKSKFEGHENYIDIQYVISGCEMLGSADVNYTVATTEYNPEKDITFYENYYKATYCIAQEGDFCIFFPHDIHRPGMAYQDVPTPVRKIVVKVLA